MLAALVLCLAVLQGVALETNQVQSSTEQSTQQQSHLDTNEVPRVRVPEPNGPETVEETVNGVLCAGCARNKQLRRRSEQEMREEEKIRVQLEKDKILAKLQLMIPPNITVDKQNLPGPIRIAVHRYITEHPDVTMMYRDDNVPEESTTKSIYLLSESETETTTETTETTTDTSVETTTETTETRRRRSINGAEPLCTETTNRICFKLLTPNDLPRYSAQNASLWLAQQTPLRNKKFDLLLAQHDRINGAKTETFAEAFEVVSDSEGKLRMDVSDLVRKWAQDGADKTRHLSVECLNCDDDALVSTGTERPYIELDMTAESRGQRTRRALRHDDCTPGLYDICCLKRFFINFTEVGWGDWIIQPHGYYANYCTGSCRHGSTRHNHGQVLSNTQVTAPPDEARPQDFVYPCCAPGQMSDLDLLFAVSPGDIRKKTLTRMRVESCGC